MIHHGITSAEQGEVPHLASGLRVAFSVKMKEESRFPEMTLPVGFSILPKIANQVEHYAG